DCVYVLTSRETGSEQLCRINAADNSVTTRDLTGLTTESRSSAAIYGVATAPPVDTQRTAFSADESELLQVDVRLVQKKITERKAIKNDSITDWEEADKNTSTGWGKDAMVIAQAAANDMQREMTGGVELVDESTYEVVLRRPFAARIPETLPVK